MEFVETKSFTRRVMAALTDAEYSALQDVLTQRPDAGVLIPGAGGLRKIRWASSGHGKRGGCRVIYYWYVAGATIVMLDLYAKNERSDIPKVFLKQLAAAVKEEFGS